MKQFGVTMSRAVSCHYLDDYSRSGNSAYQVRKEGYISIKRRNFLIFGISELKRVFVLIMATNLLPAMIVKINEGSSRYISVIPTRLLLVLKKKSTEIGNSVLGQDAATIMKQS